MYQVWRQAYKADDIVKDAAVITSSNISYLSAIAQFTKNSRYLDARDGNAYWLGLQLFDNEADANSEVHSMDRYGR